MCSFTVCLSLVLASLPTQEGEPGWLRWREWMYEYKHVLEVVGMSSRLGVSLLVDEPFLSLRLQHSFLHITNVITVITVIMSSPQSRHQCHNVITFITTAHHDDVIIISADHHQAASWLCKASSLLQHVILYPVYMLSLLCASPLSFYD